MGKAAFPWSATAISLYLYCAYAYYLAHKRHVKAIETPAIAWGKAFHAAVRKNSMGAPDGSRTTFYIEKESFGKAFWVFWEPYKDLFEKNIYGYFGGLGVKALLAYWDQNQDPPTYSEKPFKQENITLEGYRLTGVMDQVRISRETGAVSVIDLKLSQGDPNSDSAIKLRRNGIQLTIYWIAAQIIWPRKPISLFINHFWAHDSIDESGKKQREVSGNFYRTERDENDAQNLLNTLECVAEGVEAGKFPMTENPWTCRSCLYKYACDKGSPEREEMIRTPIGTPDWDNILPITVKPVEPRPKQLRLKF